MYPGIIYPLDTLRHIINQNPGEFEATFLAYRWKPGQEEIVEFKKFQRGSLLGNSVEQWLEKPPEGAEIGLCSKIRWQGGSFHIPMIDFAATTSNPWQPYQPVPEEMAGGHYFETQRSFHGYGVKLMPELNFTAFMAKCLLMNRPIGGTAKIYALVDPLWVGWQLLRQFAVLRFSANTDRWTVPPRHIKNPLSKWSADL